MLSFCTIFYYKYVSACLMESSIMSVETRKGEMSHFDVRQRGRVPHTVRREASSPAALLRSGSICLVIGYYLITHSLPRGIHFYPSGPEQPLDRKHRKITRGTKFQVEWLCLSQNENKRLRNFSFSSYFFFLTLKVPPQEGTKLLLCWQRHTRGVQTACLCGVLR